MTAATSPIIERREPVRGPPAITYRRAGDRALLVEYGEMEFDLA